MQRNLSAYLHSWATSKTRKPLVIRGARQVGKTWLVRDFARQSGKQLIELNFEKQPAIFDLFATNDPKQILLNISAAVQQKVKPQNSLLFLDEIQAAPQLLAKLRWFAEEMPELPVIATGSLLEFVLADHNFSMPVGRISYAHLEPLSFEEFLLAQDRSQLLDFLCAFDFNMAIPDSIHTQLLGLFKEYLLVGGLPAAVVSWISNHSLSELSMIQRDLLANYRDDFNKYKSRLAIERLDEAMMAIPKTLGQKIVFSRINPEIQSNVVKQALSLLERARVVYKVRSCSANGVPLAAEIKEKYFKEVFLDVGLCSAALGLGLNQFTAITEIIFINSGGIAEQVVGQMLRTVDPPYIEPALHCWHREEPGSNAEIDYIIQHGPQAIPIEVKAGATGSLKSLHLFMGLKRIPVAVRVNSDIPSKVPVAVKDYAGNRVQYELLSIPFYLCGQIHRLLDM